MQLNKPNYPKPGTMITRSLAVVTDQIIHHTAGPRTQTPLELDAYHRQIGDSMVGYNFLITPDGMVHEGRPLNFVPAAAYGRNTQSVNVCLVGNFHEPDKGYNGPPTAAQVLALKELSVLIHKLVPTIVRTIGHNEVAKLYYKGSGDYATACPGSELIKLIPDVKKYVSAHMAKL